MSTYHFIQCSTQCGKIKFCFLELCRICLSEYFWSMVGWIHEYRTHGYEGLTLYLLGLVGYSGVHDLNILIDLVCVCSIHYWKWDIEVFNSFCRAISLFKSVKSILNEVKIPTIFKTAKICFNPLLCARFWPIHVKCIN